MTTKLALSGSMRVHWGPDRATESLLWARRVCVPAGLMGHAQNASPAPPRRPQRWGAENSSAGGWRLGAPPTQGPGGAGPVSASGLA